MKSLLPRAGAGRLRMLAALLLALLALAWVLAACTAPPPITPGAPTAVSAGVASPSAPPAAPSPTTAAQASPSAPSQAEATAATGPKFDVSKLKTGVDANGHFYRGEANAPVKLIEYSDFQ